MTTTKQEFENQNDIGYQILFIFLGGFLGDIVINILAKQKIHIPIINSQFAGNLLPYYKSLTYGYTGTKGILLSALLGGILGGLACVVALLLAKLFMHIKDIEDDTL